MLGKLFGNKDNKSSSAQSTPSILGLRIGGSFEVDSLLLRLVEKDLVISGADSTHIIQAVGLVDLGGTWIYRFYTDDEGFLQVVAEGGQADENVVDVKLFYYYDTQDVPTDAIWDSMLNHEIGAPQYMLEGHTYERVWTSAGTYHNPVHMVENTYDTQGNPSQTDQFTMLFEREIAGGNTEALFVSAEEVVENNNLSRCLVLSTGLSLTPSQITIHG